MARCDVNCTCVVDLLTPSPGMTSTSPSASLARATTCTAGSRCPNWSCPSRPPCRWQRYPSSSKPNAARRAPARSIHPTRKPCSSTSARRNHDASPPRGSSSLSSSRKTRPPSESARASPPPTHHSTAFGSLRPRNVFRRSVPQSTKGWCQAAPNRLEGVPNSFVKNPLTRGVSRRAFVTF